MTGRNSSHSFRENSSEFAEFLGTGAITPGPTASNTVVLAVPIDVLESLGSLKDAFRSRTPGTGSIAPPA